MQDALMNLTVERVLEIASGPCREVLLAKYPDVEEVVGRRTPVIVYPAAGMGRVAAERLRERGIEVLALGDSNPAAWSSRGNEIPVRGPDELQALHPNVPILIASTPFDSEISEMLAKKGCRRVIPVGVLNLAMPDVFVSREYSGCMEAVCNPAHHGTIRRVYDSLADEESRRVYASKLLFYVTMEKSLLDGIRSRYPIYLEETVHSLLPDEVVVDGGAYRGDTLQEFLDVSGGKFRTYYAFEPDPSNFSALKRLAVVDGERVVAVEAGLARQAGRLRFQPTGTEAAKLLAGEEAGEATARVVGLDDFFSGKPGPTFVKMDIEGGERDALQGAAKLIAGDAPKLAISAYHHAEDLWEVPALIQSLHSGYKLYCRHYTREIADTVCYAMPPR